MRNSLKESEASVANLRTHCSTIESDNARLLETNSHLTQLYRDSVTKSSPSDHSQRNENNYLPPAAKKVSISPRNQYISRSYDSGLTRSKSQDSQKSMKSSSVAGILIPADEEYFYDEENDSPKQRAKDYVEKELNRTKNQLRNSKDNQVRKLFIDLHVPINNSIYSILKQALESMVRRYDSGDRSNSNSPRRSTQPISADSSRNTSRSCSSSPSRGNHAVSFSRSSSKSPSRMSNKSCMKQPLEGNDILAILRVLDLPLSLCMDRSRFYRIRQNFERLS